MVKIKPNNKLERLILVRDKAYQDYLDASEAVKNEELSQANLDRFLGKFIRTGPNRNILMFVKEIFKTKDPWKNSDDYFMLRGVGFESEFTPYMDALNFRFDGMYEYRLYVRSVLETDKLDEIEIITKEEFFNEFNKAIEKLNSESVSLSDSNYFETAEA